MASAIRKASLSGEGEEAFGRLVELGCDRRELERRLALRQSALDNSARKDVRQRLGVAREWLRTIRRALSLAADVDELNRSAASPVRWADDEDRPLGFVESMVPFPGNGSRGRRLAEIPELLGSLAAYLKSEKAQAVERSIRGGLRTHVVLAEAVILEFVRASLGRPHYRLVGPLVGSTEETLRVRTAEFRKQWGKEPLPSVEDLEASFRQEANFRT